MRDIAVAVVCYNNEAEVVEFTKNLSKQSIIDNIQLLVTCNAVGDFEKFQKEIENVMPSALVYNPGKNLGYLPGCLYGVEQSGRMYSWVMVSNTDIEIIQSNFFDAAFKEVGDDIWCIGPDIKLASIGVHQNPFLKKRPTKSKVTIWRIAYSCFPLFWLYFKLYDLKPQKNKKEKLQIKSVYAVHGSCFLLKRECVDRILEEKPNVFMYGEELIIAEIIKSNGKTCFFDSDLKILHNENQVTGKIESKRKQRWFKESMNFYIHLFKRNDI
ncbi:hypothetical protein BXO88_14530 [Oribacterium sp. C9]|uniref:glycosyltransferase family 2 protein n=1 Tax=Oribacterium sp. C9 TaxID=1943579 RepID=UPI00098FF524|nr:glycosyltransferase family 2 protein [Oribacterium sp. C9]OON85000.1 hypothetical protein BXO88_14530 [Oribacterium sp. C9]